MNTIKTVTAMEARKRFGEIMNRVALRGERFTVARAGRPLARIVPIPANAANTNIFKPDIFDAPFARFTEWSDPSNDAYDAL